MANPSSPLVYSFLECPPLKWSILSQLASQPASYVIIFAYSVVLLLTVLQILGLREL